MNFIKLFAIKQQQFMIPNLQSLLIGKKSFNCPRHKTQYATHICTNTKCLNTPVLCSQCFGEHINHNYHYDHEKNILPLDQAVTCLSNDIKSISPPVQKLFKSTVSKNQFGGLLAKLDKGQQIYHEFDSQINEIKNLLQTQIQILTAEFQKSLQMQKQECFKVLDNYKKYFNKNIEYLSSHVQNIMQFNNQLKYFSNKNTFYLKISEKVKNSQWIIKVKKNLQNITKIVDNTSYPSQISNILNAALRLRLDNEVNFRRDQTLNERNGQMKYLAKKIIGQLITIPQLKYLQDQVQNGSGNITSGLSSGSTGLTKNYYYSSTR